VLRKAVVLTVGLLVVVGCAQEPGDTPPDDAAALAKVVVTERPGQSPLVTLPTVPFYVSTPVARLVTDGHGAALLAGQELLVGELVVSCTDGSVVDDGWTSQFPDLVVGKNSVLDAVLTTAHIGAQVLFALPNATDCDVLLLVITDVVLTQADGTPVPPVPGLPTISVDDAGVPTSMSASGTPPSNLVVQPLLASDRPPAKAGDTIKVHYSGWLWDGTAFDSSWAREPFTLTLGADQVIAGWDQGLVGQSAGSRVLLVIPPALAYEDKDKGQIPPGSTLVFVVDILAVF